MKKILMVCLGNICRSPIAEGLFATRIKEMGLESKFQFDSAGTSANHIGEDPDKRSRLVCLEREIVLNHRARQFKVGDFQDFDQILVMDKSNLRDLQCMTKEIVLLNKIKNIAEFHTEYPRVNHIPDPYYDDLDRFREVFELLDNCFRVWIKRIT